MRPRTKLTPYTLWKNKTPNIKYFRVFGIKCYILRDCENAHKFNSKSGERLFLGYSLSIKAYRAYNIKTKSFIKFVNLVVDDVVVKKTTQKELADLEKVSQTTNKHDQNIDDEDNMK